MHFVVSLCVCVQEWGCVSVDGWGLTLQLVYFLLQYLFKNNQNTKINIYRKAG